MKLLLTHPGTQYAPLLAAQLYKQGILHHFVTGIAYGEDQALSSWVHKKIKADRRKVWGVPKNKILSLKAHDLLSVVLKKRGWHNDDIFFHTNGWFEKKVPAHFIRSADIVIGFDTSSRFLIDRAHAYNKPYVMDVSIAHPVYKEQVFEMVRKRFPDWSTELKPKKQRNIEAELSEIEKADYFVVATAFTQKTYLENGVNPNKIFVNPYGTNLQYFKNKWHTVDNSITDKKEITFLFFGSLTARKGFPWLCEIWQRITARYPHAKLIAAGHGVIPSAYKIPDGIKILGSIHPQERNALFAQADVFVFPSYFEGFAQVIIEAMACGLPVITTTHTVGPEIIRPAENGFLAAPDDDDALYNSMRFFLENKEAIQPMGMAAYESVTPYTWDAYGERWKSIAQEILNRNAAL